jgi:hypothetical protein
MNSFTDQQTGIQPFNVPPCPGCSTGMYTGQTGMPSQGIMPMTQPMVPPRQDLLSQMPTGIPQGSALGTAPLMQQSIRQQATTPSQDLAPIMPWNQPIPVTTESLMYMNGFMRTQIGRRVTVEFLIGTNTLVDKSGTLLAVGANYILINEIESDDILLCDFYSIKFMKFYY